MGKYDRWEGFFQDLEGERQEIPLDVLEEKVDGDLPPTAIREKAWWSGDHYYAWWLKAGWYASLQPSDGTVIFSRTPFRRGRPAKAKRSPTPAASPSEPLSRPPQEVPVGARLVLVGCVAQKRSAASPAKDLYTSPLWKKRRRYAESTDMPWFVLSAEHGLLDPEAIIESYDRYMERENRSYREEWSRVAANDVLKECRAKGLGAVEVHAGAAYLEHGLISTLRRSGIDVLWPLKGHRIGEQLGWYDRVAAGDVNGFSTSVNEPVPATRDLVMASVDHATGVAEVYRSGVLGESWSDLPEVWSLPPDAEPIERRLWITFVAAVDRARDAESLWRSAHEAWSANPWIFQPAEVVARGFVDLADTLRFHGLSQRHTPDAASWRSIAESLDSKQCPSPIRSAIWGDATSADALLRSLEATWPHGTPVFPQLSGPKIGPMWVRMLAYPGGAVISGIDTIPVAVDTHVQRVTEMLGLVEPRSLDESHRNRIRLVWFDAVAQAGSFGAPEGIDGTAAGLDPALWALGKEGCSRCERSSQKVPVGPVCDLCVLGRL